MSVILNRYNGNFNGNNDGGGSGTTKANYRQYFPNESGNNSVTVTENGGIIPTDGADFHVMLNGMVLVYDVDYTADPGTSQINFTNTIRTPGDVEVKFYI